MSDELIIRHCSPTLAGLKTGNIFSCTYVDSEELRDQLRKWNLLLGDKGLRILPLRRENGRALIYLYRPKRLCNDLHNRMACKLLRERGYCVDAPARCVMRLIERIQEEASFPHEIGLFLGYPPEDVSGFIENHAEKCKCVGCWKVYGDADAAQRVLQKYRKCTRVYCAQHAKGASIERLAVAG